MPQAGVHQVHGVNFKDGKKAIAPFTFDAPGTYPVTVTLTDNEGESRTRTFRAVVD